MGNRVILQVFKATLKIKHIISRNENAMKVMIYITLILAIFNSGLQKGTFNKRIQNC